MFYLPIKTSSKSAILERAGRGTKSVSKCRSSELTPGWLPKSSAKNCVRKRWMSGTFFCICCVRKVSQFIYIECCKLSKGLTAWCYGSCLRVKRPIVTSTKRPLFTVWAPIGFICLFHRPFRPASSCWCECAGTRNRGTGRRSPPSCFTCRSLRPT